MNIYFTSDCHFDHANIIRFCDRPFLKKGDVIDGEWKSDKIKLDRCRWMNEEIIKRWNNKVKPDDLVYHVGDFSFKGNDSCKYFEDRLNGTIVHIKGNHDKNNGVKTYIRCCIMEWGGLSFYVLHHPPEENQIGTLEARIMSSVDVVLCGHVHGKWKHKIIPFNVTKRIICINVGVDVWDFEPVSIHSILKYISKVRRGLIK